jgi:hypothetical protein
MMFVLVGFIVAMRTLGVIATVEETEHGGAGFP